MRNFTFRRLLLLSLLMPPVVSGCLWQNESQTPQEASTLEPQERIAEAADAAAGDSESWFELGVYGGFNEAEEVSLPGPHEARLLYARGQYLVQAVAACGSCHGSKPAVPNSPLTGGRLMEDRHGEVYAPNITPDKETGIGNWNIAEVMRAIRAAIAKDGSALSMELHEGYRWIAEEDAKAIAVYLLAQRPVRNEVSRRKLGEFERRRWGLISRHSEIKGIVPSLPDKPTHQYGRYLSDQVAGCKNCHTGEDKFLSAAEPYSGTKRQKEGMFAYIGKLIGLGQNQRSDTETGDVQALLSDAGLKEFEAGQSKEFSRNAQPTDSEDELSTRAPGPDIRGNSETGLKNWTLTQITEYLFTGITPEGRQSNPLDCPWTYYRQMNLNDRMAIARYLKRL